MYLCISIRALERITVHIITFSCASIWTETSRKEWLIVDKNVLESSWKLLVALVYCQRVIFYVHSCYQHVIGQYDSINVAYNILQDAWLFASKHNLMILRCFCVSIFCMTVMLQWVRGWLNHLQVFVLKCLPGIFWTLSRKHWMLNCK